MIFAEDLSKQFDDILAVDHIRLDVGSGKVLVLLGPNGAGKTTTVRMLTSVLRPTTGTARVAGYDVVSQSSQVRANVGVLTEHHGLYGRMNAREYLKFYGSLYNLSSKAIDKRSGELLELFGLAFAARKRLGEYSKGMRQKLALVRAMLHDPPVLLLDEPTSAMDPESAKTVRDAIHNLRDSHRTILLCTHNLAEAELLADQIAIIRRGKIIYQGESARLKRELLGAPVYEVRLAGGLNGYTPTLPAGVELVGRGDDSLQFRVIDPEAANPVLLNDLVQAGLPVISFSELPRSLEQAYLEAVSRDQEILHG
ncbi:MAG: ABC transporter ATP-binding protein [Leptolinea sp.]|jgi:ABC-2 type transport system ATP-binding protein|nr:ABC transporter ATP-binding protein [Leptolinea sp.]